MIDILWWVGAGLLVVGGIRTAVSQPSSLAEVQGSFVILVGSAALSVAAFLEGHGSRWWGLGATVLAAFFTYLFWVAWQASRSQDADSSSDHTA